MARHKAFDPETAILAVMRVFWAKGYEAASITDLEAATGIARTSLYNAFGDKDAIFDAALARYHALAQAQIADALDGKDLDAIAQLFSGLAEPHDLEASGNFGCLMVNTVLDVRNVTGAAAERVKAYRSMLLEAFAACIDHAQSEGRARAELVPENAAAFLVANMWGVLATVRLYADAAAAKPIVDQVLETMSSWRSDQSNRS